MPATFESSIEVDEEDLASAISHDELNLMVLLALLADHPGPASITAVARSQVAEARPGFTARERQGIAALLYGLLGVVNDPAFPSTPT